VPRPAITFLNGDRRTAEYRAWTPWLKAVSALVARFAGELADDPLAYNETASVSLLAAGAAKAGHLGIAEFSTVKGHKADGADLRMAAATSGWPAIRRAGGSSLSS
jgi:hypothetical protein